MRGGAVRVGRAVALALARGGIDVAIEYHRSGRAAQCVVAELRASSARATAVRADLADPAAARRLVATAARVMTRGGHIVNIGDGGAASVRPAYVPLHAVEDRDREPDAGTGGALRPRGIAVNGVAPGAVLRSAGFARARWWKVTRGQAGSVAEVGAAGLFFAICPRYITGQVLGVDGGEGATT